MINRLSRRGFLGVMSVVPVLVPAVGSLTGRYESDPDPIQAALKATEDSDTASEAEVVTPLIDGPKRALRGAVGLRLMHKAVNRHLRDLDLRLVGKENAGLCDCWGSGTFTKVVYLKVPHAERDYDSLAFESLAKQFADRIRAEDITRIGRLHGMLDVHKFHLYDDKRRLSMRYVEYYEMRVNAFIGRFDVLGGPA